MSSSLFVVFVGWFFFFLLAVFHFEEHSICQAKGKKKCPVRILETLFLLLQSIEKANFCFFISLYLSTCKLSYVTVSPCDLLRMPFLCHIAHKPIPASFCSRKSLDAKHMKCRSLAVSWRNTNQSTPLCYNSWMPFCVQHLEIRDSWGQTPAYWSNAAEGVPSPEALCRRGFFCTFM